MDVLDETCVMVDTENPGDQQEKRSPPNIGLRWVMTLLAGSIFAVAGLIYNTTLFPGELAAHLPWMNWFHSGFILSWNATVLFLFLLIGVRGQMWTLKRQPEVVKASFLPVTYVIWTFLATNSVVLGIWLLSISRPSLNALVLGETLRLWLAGGLFVTIPTAIAAFVGMLIEDEFTEEQLRKQRFEKGKSAGRFIYIQDDLPDEKAAAYAKGLTYGIVQGAKQVTVELIRELLRPFTEDWQIGAINREGLPGGVRVIISGQAESMAAHFVLVHPTEPPIEVQLASGKFTISYDSGRYCLLTPYSMEFDDCDSEELRCIAQLLLEKKYVEAFAALPFVYLVIPEGSVYSLIPENLTAGSWEPPTPDELPTEMVLDPKDEPMVSPSPKFPDDLQPDPATEEVIQILGEPDEDPEIEAALKDLTSNPKNPSLEKGDSAASGEDTGEEPLKITFAD